MSIASRTGFVGPSRMAGTSTPVSNCRIEMAVCFHVHGFGRHPSPRCRDSGGHGFGVRPSLMDVTRSCLKREGGASGLWMAPPVLLPCDFPITRRRVWCHGRRCRPWDGAFRLALEVDHEHVVIEGVELEVVSVPERAALERVVVPSLSSTRPLAASSQIASSWRIG